jgi:glycerophosphoryl diester phosphodiesterase/pimeloyl-ACP methyl ester carboxylesterase
MVDDETEIRSEHDDDAGVLAPQRRVTPLIAALLIGALLATVAAVTFAVTGNKKKPSATSVEGSSNDPSAAVAAILPSTFGKLLKSDSFAGPRNLKSWRVLFTSSLRDGKETQVSGLVFVPDRPAPTGGWPVLSYAHATVGLADVCAPSKNLGMLENTVAGLFGQNMVVVMSDYPGLGTPGPHPFLDGNSAGRSVLDIVRAAQTIPGVQVSKRVVMWGHSQGGHAALFAGELAPLYTPELEVVGVAAGAVPAELTKFTDQLAASPRRGYIPLIAAGLVATNPKLKLTDALTPDGVKLAQRLDTECSDVVVDAGAQTNLLKPSGIPNSWKETLATDEPGTRAIEAPVFLIHGDKDELVPLAASESVEKRYSTLGVKIQRKVYPGAKHAGSALASLSDVTAWINGRINATGSPSTATTTSGVSTAAAAAAGAGGDIANGAVTSAPPAESPASSPAWKGASGLLLAALQKGEQQTLVIAHAGGEQEAPHSTMYAFKRAHSIGVDVLEMDVRLSSDNQLVVFHDARVDRTTDRAGPVVGKSAAQLEKLNAAYWFVPGCWDCRTTAKEFPLRGVRVGSVPLPSGSELKDFGVTTLRALMDQFPDTVFDIEIKADGPDRGQDVAKVLATQLSADPKPDRFIVVSFDDAALSTFRQAAPTISTSPGLNEISGYVLSGKPLSPTPLLQIPPRIGPLSVYNEALQKRAKADGIAIWVWPEDSTTDTKATYEALLKTKPNGIIAGRPQEMLSLR